MKILMHCVYYPPEVGGLESHVHYLCRALAQMGHRVDVVTSHSMKETPRTEVMDGVYVHRTWFPGKSTVGWIAHAAGSVPATVAAARDADILHAQAFQSIPPLIAARTRSAAPLVSTWHTSHFLRLATRPGWATILGRLVAAGDANLAASAEIASVAESLAPDHHVQPVTNGVETSIFQASEPVLPIPESGRRRLIVPRRLFEKNGVEFAVRAIPLIIERHDVEAVLVGDGPERGRLEALAGELGVRGPDPFPGGPCACGYAGAVVVRRAGDLPLVDGGDLGRGSGVHGVRDPCCSLPRRRVAGDRRRLGRRALRSGRSRRPRSRRLGSAQ